MPGGDAVRVEGLADFRRAVRQLGGKELGKGLRATLNASALFLIEKAQPLIPRRTGAAAKSLKARSSQDSVRIAVGGKRAPYYPWLDFGGRVGPAGGVHRPFIKSGRYLYPTLTAHSADFERLMESGLADVARAAGIDVD